MVKFFERRAHVPSSSSARLIFPHVFQIQVQEDRIAYRAHTESGIVVFEAPIRLVSLIYQSVCAYHAPHCVLVRILDVPRNIICVRPISVVLVLIMLFNVFR